MALKISGKDERLRRADFRRFASTAGLLTGAADSAMDDLVAALQSGQIAGAALDVYETEPLPKESPLRALPQIIMTPHLGASTEEAQENVGIEVAEAITDFLLSGAVRNAVNLPSLDAKTYAVVKPFLTLAEKLGRVVAQLAPKRKLIRPEEESLPSEMSERTWRLAVECVAGCSDKSAGNRAYPS